METEEKKIDRETIPDETNQNDTKAGSNRTSTKFRNGYSAKTNKICGILLEIIGLLYIPLGIFLVSEGSTFKGTAAALFGLLLFRLGKKFVEISKNIEDSKK